MIVPGNFYLRLYHDFSFSSLSWMRIWYRVQKTAYQGQPSQNLLLLNPAQYKKSVKNALWAQLTLVVCYLPYAVAQALPKNPHELSQSLYLVWAMALTLVALNSSLNPILYYWRIGEER